MYLYSSIRGDHLLSTPGPSCGAVAPAEPRGTSACGGPEAEARGEWRAMTSG